MSEFEGQRIVDNVCVDVSPCILRFYTAKVWLFPGENAKRAEYKRFWKESNRFRILAVALPSPELLPENAEMSK